MYIVHQLNQSIVLGLLVTHWHVYGVAHLQWMNVWFSYNASMLDCGIIGTSDSFLNEPLGRPL